ncbi:MAG TPA: tetratricopeptide repeat protein [Acidobacteriota bacterium]|nr:tetratricopeptide repeat protein [Acidobacteriota bacterium]
MNSSKYIFVCIAALFVLFFALPIYADGTLQVKCLDQSGAASQNAKVIIMNMANQKAKDKKSDAQGIAEFAKIEDGVYRVIARKDGFVPALYEFAVLKGNTESVTLNLASGADKKLYFEDPAEEKRAAQLVQEGVDTAKQSKYEEAEKLFTQSLQITPSSPQALYWFGVTNVSEGKFDKAVELLNQAQKVADALKTLPSAAASNPNQYELISRNAKQLLSQMPTYRGEQALRQKNWDLAIKIFTDAMKDDPNNPDLYYNMAIARTYTNKFDEATAMVDKAIQLKPGEKSFTELKSKIAARKESAALENAQALMLEGDKMLDGGDAAGALKKYEEANSMIKEDRQAPLLMRIGKAQAKLNQPDAAVAAFKKSMELAPADKIGNYRDAFAQFYIDSKKYDDAINVLTDPKAVASSEQTLLDLAKTWKNKEPNFAIAALEKVIKIDPANADVYFDLGQLYYMDGKSKDGRTKELLNKYLEVGKDADKIQGAKDMMVIVNKRSK